MANPVIEAVNFLDIATTTQVQAQAGKLCGIFVASASSTPTIKVWDSLTATGPVIANTFTPVSATFYPLPARYVNGLFVTISGTVDCTVFYDPT